MFLAITARRLFPELPISFNYSNKRKAKKKKFYQLLKIHRSSSVFLSCWEGKNREERDNLERKICGGKESPKEWFMESV